MKPREIVAAYLRSGRYTQYCGRLKQGDCMCIMGVACQAYMDYHPDEFEWKNREHHFAFSGSMDDDLEVRTYLQDAEGHNYETTAPLEVMDWLKLPFDVEENLMYDNDEGVSFGELAQDLLDAAETQEHI